MTPGPGSFSVTAPVGHHRSAVMNGPACRYLRITTCRACVVPGASNRMK